jgi:hypothetical protein
LATPEDLTKLYGWGNLLIDSLVRPSRSETKFADDPVGLPGHAPDGKEPPPVEPA